jgi:exonuclease VII small subunit
MQSSMSAHPKSRARYPIVPRLSDPKPQHLGSDTREAERETALVRSPRVVLVAFLAGLALSLLGVTVALVRGVVLWRQAKRTGGALSAEMSTFEEGAERAERHLAEWERSSAELERALEQLRRSRAGLQVLLDSVERAQARIRWLRVFVPR